MAEPSRDELTRWVHICMTEGRNLTKWEEEFLWSMQHRLEEHRSLSERQVEVLEKIYEEKTGPFC